MKFTPLNDRVLIRSAECETKTAGGVLLPDNAQFTPQEGEVVAVGPGIHGTDGKFVKTTLRTGDRVVFGKWGGNQIKIDGEELTVMRESEIFGVLAA